MGTETKPAAGGGRPAPPPPPTSAAASTLTREQIRDIYRKVVARDPQPKSRQKGRSYLQAQVVAFLSAVEHAAKFCRQISDTIDRSIREVIDWDPEEAAEAFLAVEKYALNVLDYPWKSEFKVVKLYTGFYCGRVSPHLKGAADLFKMMGYEQLDKLRLVLKRASSAENLLYVACECYVAAMECMLMTRILERVEVVNYVLSDVYRARRECRGDVDMAVLWITGNCEASRPATSTQTPRARDAMEKAERERQEKDNRRYADLGYRPRDRDRDRRWEQCDDRLSPVHAYGFGYQNRNLALGHTAYDSMGRPVRGLSDASLTAHGTGSVRDSGVVVTMEVPTPASAGRIGRVGGNPHFTYDGPTYDLPAADFGDVADGNSLPRMLPESASDYDLYAAGTIDDHLQRSLLYIQRMDTGPKSLKEAQVPPASLKDDWGDVRENLRSKYGDKYFEGERGDILKENPGSTKLIDLGVDDRDQEGAGNDCSRGESGQPLPFKAVVEPQTKQRYDTVLQEISGKLSSRRVPTPSPPDSATPKRSPPAYQSPPTAHRNPPPPPPPKSSQHHPQVQQPHPQQNQQQHHSQQHQHQQQSSPPQQQRHNQKQFVNSALPTSKPNPQQSGRPGTGLSHCGLEPSRRMPCILENSAHLQQSVAVVAAAADAAKNKVVSSGVSASGGGDVPSDSICHFPPPPSDLQPLDSLGSIGEVEGEDDMPPPPPESLDGADAGAQKLLDNMKDDHPFFNLALSCCRKEPVYDDARFLKPRFQSFGVEDGEFLLKRERGPSPPPRLLPRNGKPNGPYRPERRSYYDNVDNDSNMSSPMGTSSTLSSSADTVVAAAERLSIRPSPLDEEEEAEEDVTVKASVAAASAASKTAAMEAAPALSSRSSSSPSAGSSPSIIRKKPEVTVADRSDGVQEGATSDNNIGPLRRLSVKSQSYEEQRRPTAAAAVEADHPRPKSVGFSADDGAAKWQCATCTFKNLASHSACDMCGRSRDIGPDLDPVLAGGPQCPYCTLVNAEGAKLCDACGADLEGCATYI